MECIHKPWTIVTLRRVFTYALQAHWGYPGNHPQMLEEELGCLRFSDDENEDIPHNDRLAVAPVQTFDEKRPFQGVYIGTREGYSMDVKSFDHVIENLPDNSGSKKGTHADTVVYFKHVHRNFDVAANMAESTAVFLMGLREQLKAHPQHGASWISRIGEPVLIEKSPEKYYQCEVDMNLRFTFSAKVQLESHRLKDYMVSLLAENNCTSS